MGKNRNRPFWLSFGISIFMIILVAGCITVDYQGRKMTFADSAPPFEIQRKGETAELEIRLFGAEKEVEVTEIVNFWDFFRDFSCIPHQ